jgi:type IV secretory pathway TrbD component
VANALLLKTNKAAVAMTRRLFSLSFKGRYAMSFAHVLIIIFCSPLFFLLKGRMLGLIFNGLVYLIALGFVLTIALAPIGVFFWAVAFTHGMWSLRKDVMKEQATAMAQAMAAEMRNAAATTNAPPSMG